MAALLLVGPPILDRFSVRCRTRRYNMGVGLGAVIYISWKLNCFETPAIGRP